MRRLHLGPCASLFTKSGSSGGRGGGVVDGPSGEIGETERKGEILHLEEKLRTLSSECVAGCGRSLGKSPEIFKTETGISGAGGLGNGLNCPGPFSFLRSEQVC